MLYNDWALIQINESYTIHFEYLELLCDVSRVGWQPGTAGDKTQEQNSLLIGEFFKALPEPDNQLVALCDVTVAHHLLQHLHRHLRQTADQLLQLPCC